MTIGEIIIGTKKWNAVSGGYGKGPIPHGTYGVPFANYEFSVGDRKKYMGSDYAWYLKLEPFFDTDRKDLLIHPDSGVIGTRGCIGVVNNDIKFIEEVEGLFMQKKLRKLSEQVILEVL